MTVYVKFTGPINGKRPSLTASTFRFPFMSDCSFFKIDSNSVLSTCHLISHMDCSLLTVSEFGGYFRVDEHGPQVLIFEFVHVDNTFTTPVISIGFLLVNFRFFCCCPGHCLHSHHILNVSCINIGIRLGFRHSFLHLFSELIKVKES